ncbi:hypothetical protein [Microcystis aeruginosa]|uniref:Uncharacterized protein n=1 Tax=Microcystis aeruginosa NIES-3787 TaxID=2517782 RepID=A0A6H9GD14_MICAE|nr:hypothetical protein [Microcystis aeruginosa]GCL47839.1 hypothetical protein NIES3787_35500 [Microcystis aeruginosa NIES-3787]
MKKEQWENLNLVLSIFTSSVATVSIIILGLSLILKKPWIYEFIQTLKAETFSIKGYIYYRPLLSGDPSDNYAWFLVTDSPDNSIDALKKGDYLFYALDGTYYLRNLPEIAASSSDKNGAIKSRAVFFIRENQCVKIIEDNLQKNIDSNQYPKEDSIKVPAGYTRIRPETYYYYDPIKGKSVASNEKGEPFKISIERDNAKSNREKEIKQEIKKTGTASQGIWLKVAVTPCPNIEP